MVSRCFVGGESGRGSRRSGTGLDLLGGCLLCTLLLLSRECLVLLLWVLIVVRCIRATGSVYEL